MIVISLTALYAVTLSIVLTLFVWVVLTLVISSLNLEGAGLSVMSVLISTSAVALFWIIQALRYFEVIKFVA